MLNRPSRYLLCTALCLLLAACSKQVPPSTPVPPEPTEPHQHVHEEVEIPTPLAELKEPPLDLIPYCENTPYCAVLLLYPDRLELLDWKSGSTKQILLKKIRGIRSRAPSGKLIKSGSYYWVLHNNYPEPLCFNSELNTCEDAAPAPLNFPRAAPGVNYFFLYDGKFYDLEIGAEQKMAVIETSRHLSIAESGRRVTSQERVGGCLAISWPVFYTSSPSLPEEADAILKFAIEQDALVLKTSRPILGQILDITVSDLNQDEAFELLATVKTANGIFIQVFDAF